MSVPRSLPPRSARIRAGGLAGAVSALGTAAADYWRHGRRPRPLPRLRSPATGRALPQPLLSRPRRERNPRRSIHRPRERVIGLLVGMTGAGGGALMTPMLILLFGVKPSAAISSDLVAAVLMRPVGAAVHLRKGTVNLRLVGWMVLGSVPMAFLGSYLLHADGHMPSRRRTTSRSRSARRCWSAPSAMVLRYVLDRAVGQSRTAAVHEVTPRPLPHRRDRHDRRADRRHHLGRLRLADDHPAAVPLPADRRQASSSAPT